jgi:hypothetical protein
MSNDWTSDNDESVFDEWLLELDTRWRVLRRLGLAYDDEQDEAEREIDKAVARNAGSAILDLVPANYRDDFIGQYTLTAFPPAPAAPGSEQVGPQPRDPVGMPPAPRVPLLPTAPLGIVAAPAIVMPAARAALPAGPGIGPGTPQPAPAAFAKPAGPLALPVRPLPVVQGPPPAAPGLLPAYTPPAAPVTPPRVAPPLGVLTPRVPRGRRFSQPPMSDC